MQGSPIHGYPQHWECVLAVVVVVVGVVVVVQECE